MEVLYDIYTCTRNVRKFCTPVRTIPGVLVRHSSSFFFFFAHFYFPASGQAVDTGVIPSPPRFLPSIFIAHRVQQSHCSSIVHRVLLTHALALSACQFVHNKKSQRFFTSMHSAGLELTKLTYTRLEDNLIRHRGDRLLYPIGTSASSVHPCYNIRNFWKFCKTSVPVPRPSGSSVRTSDPYPEVM